MRIFFSVGEPSGDVHAANLIRQLRRREPNLQAVGYGGPKMAEAGCDLHFDLTQLAVMFLSGAIRNLRTFFKLIANADSYFATHPVDAVVLIDYPGFNWWIARKAKKHNVPVFYYGVPQMWAWAPWRIKKVRKFVDFVICKLPFEKKWFADRGCDAFYVGHPYFDQLNSQVYDDAFRQQLRSDTQQTVLLLPGSRSLELQRNLKSLLTAGKRIQAERPDVRLVMGCLNDAHAKIALAERDKADVKCEVYSNRTQELMQVADVCAACSGSVSLELLHHRLPTVIVYRVRLWVYLVQIVALRCKYISLPNLMMADDIRKTRLGTYDPDAAGAEPVLMPEYLSWSDRSPQIADRLLMWLDSESLRRQNVADLNRLAEQFAIPGATQRAADHVLEQLGRDLAAANSAA